MDGHQPHVASYLGRVLLGDDPVGTCFQMSSGLLVSAWHVLVQAGAEGDGAEVSIDPLEVGAGDPFIATVHAFDEPHDLAVLEADRSLGGSIETLRSTDTLDWNATFVVTGVAEIYDPGKELRYTDAVGSWGGKAVRNEGIAFGRLKSSDVLLGMSGAPVRPADDDSVVVGVVSARFISPDGWYRDTVWMARTEDLEVLLTGRGDWIERPRLQRTADVPLSPEEQMALGLILCDPEAASRGAWLYPLHGDLAARGLTPARITLALNGLIRLGLIEHVDVPALDPMIETETTAPAYRISAKGLDVARTYPSISEFRDRYSYVLRLAGTDESNRDFLERLRSRRTVEAQTRFILADAEGESRIAAWSHEPLDGAFASIAAETGATVVGVKRV